MRESLPQLDGSLAVYGLTAPVTVARDAHGVPHIHANSLEDLVFAQGFVTAQDRLWQMDLLRRLPRASWPPSSAHPCCPTTAWSARYSFAPPRTTPSPPCPPIRSTGWRSTPAGVNASMAAQHDHLPVEFRLLGYLPAAWTPRDTILVELAMFQELTNGYPAKLGREALAVHLPPELIADLYPTGSWRDHPPGQPIPDVTAPQPEIKDVPLDESQSKLHRSARRPEPVCRGPARA